MWDWIRNHRRRKILETPFPAEWEAIIVAGMAHYGLLNELERQALRNLVQVFIAEKNWEGCGGLSVTDEMRVMIAAEACLMILALPHDVYRNVESILIYPSTVVTPERKLGTFESARAPLPASMPILGEAHLRGPVILVWDAVKKSARHPETGHNVVFHEFAHMLDMLDGGANGTPPLADRAQYERWVRVCGREFSRLRADAAKGHRTLIDAYGATNEAEFFAVITELFFDRPAAMKRHLPELYEVLRDFYRQDPALRVLAP